MLIPHFTACKDTKKKQKTKLALFFFGAPEWCRHTWQNTNVVGRIQNNW